MDVQEQLKSLIAAHDVVLFMKGTRRFPQCGFSATVCAILDEYISEYATVNVLEDPSIRQGIKELSSWPTIPQLYVRGQFVGGCDIVRDMHESGELEGTLDVASTTEDVAAPAITLTEAAAGALRSFTQGELEAGSVPTVRLRVSASYEYDMELDEPSPNDVVVESNGCRVIVSKGSARRADGLTIDFVESVGGGGFRMENPNAPATGRRDDAAAAVQPLDVEQLKTWIDHGKPFELFDVRPEAEREKARLPQAHPLDHHGKELLESLDRDTVIVLHCHHGGRSRAAAEHCIRMGFREVYNLEGGIDAWSTKVDPAVPRY